MADFHSSYIELRALMLRSASMMQVAKDSLGELTLNLMPENIMTAKNPVWFGSVRMTTSHVSYYLMPLNRTSLFEQVPEGLKKYMQGRTCFNFTHIDPDISAQLEALTKLACSKVSVAAKCA